MTSKNELKGTVENSPERTETGQSVNNEKSTRRAKDDQRYWADRLRQRVYAHKGRTVTIPEWQIRMFFENREGWFNLGTSNKTIAASKARNVWRHLWAHGWEETIAKFKSDGEPNNIVKIGAYLTAVSESGSLGTRTFLNYQNCFRTIVSETFGVKLKKDQSRFDYRAGGNKEWVTRIDSIRIARVTPSRIETWKKHRLKKAGHSPVQIASAKRTINSYIRCARSLFAEAIRRKLKTVQLPSPLPFDGVTLLDAGSTKYFSKINAQALIAAAENELKPKDPEAYKVFLLAVGAGMRKAEIDSAEWRMVDWQHMVIKLEETEWLHLKTTDSAAEITLDEEVIAELREFMPSSKSRFVVSSVVTVGNGKKRHTRIRPPRNDSPRPYYRCAPVFERLLEWLRSKGVNANKPLHELRKEVGARIATDYGIYAASRFLRHSDIGTTARSYADQKDRVSVGFGKFLKRGIPKPDEPKAVSK